MTEDYWRDRKDLNRTLRDANPSRTRSNSKPPKEDIEFSTARNKAEAKRRQEAAAEAERMKREEDEAEKQILFALIDAEKNPVVT